MGFRREEEKRRGFPVDCSWGVGWEKERVSDSETSPAVGLMWPSV